MVRLAHFQLIVSPCNLNQVCLPEKIHLFHVVVLPLQFHQPNLERTLFQLAFRDMLSSFALKVWRVLVVLSVLKQGIFVLEWPVEAAFLFLDHQVPSATSRGFAFSSAHVEFFDVIGL